MNVGVMSDARQWLDLKTLEDELAASGGTLLDLASGRCDLLVTCGMGQRDEPAFRNSGCEVVSITPHSRHDGCVTDVTPPQFHSDLAEASILAVLERLYDLHQTERILSEDLPRPQKVVATMLKGKRIGILAEDRTAFAISRRLRGWGAVILTAVQPGDSRGTDCFPVDPEALRRCDLLLDARAGMRTETTWPGAIVPVFGPTMELREATSEAVITFLRSRDTSQVGGRFDDTMREYTEGLRRAKAVTAEHRAEE